MKIKEIELEGLRIIEPKVFEDNRGYFYESFRESVLNEAGIYETFVQDNVSKSRKNTIRGLHYQIQNPQAKLVQCLFGKILDVAVDLRQSSPTFGQFKAVELSSDNKNLFFIPKGYAHGFSVLSDEAIVSYKCSDYYNSAGERGVNCKDSGIGIDWKVKDPVLSEKDKMLPNLSSLNKEDLFK